MTDMRAGLAVLVVVVLSGCEARRAATNTSRDSLGVTIVESVGPRWAEGAAWRIHDEPIVDLAESGSGEMHLFFRVRDMLRAHGDHLVVADGVSQEVRVYDAAGQFVRAFGGAGEGPGEFRSLSTVALTVVGRLIAMNSRVGAPGAEFDIATGLVSTLRMPQGVRPLRHTVPTTLVWGWDGGYSVDDAGLRNGLQRAAAAIVRLSEDRMSAHQVANVPGHEHVIIPEADAIPLMGRLTHVVPTGEGEVAVGTADRLEYAILDGATGDVRLIARIPGVSLAVTSEEVDRERQARLGPNPRPFIRELLEERLPVPAQKPAYQSMIVDTEGHVWAGEFLGVARRNEPQDWYVWDSAGVWLGVVRTPARFELMRVGSGEVLGVLRDVNDVEHPQVLRLVKP